MSIYDRVRLLEELCHILQSHMPDCAHDECAKVAAATQGLVVMDLLDKVYDMGLSSTLLRDTVASRN